MRTTFQNSSDRLEGNFSELQSSLPSLGVNKQPKTDYSGYFVIESAADKNYQLSSLSKPKPTLAKKRRWKSQSTSQPSGLQYEKWGEQYENLKPRQPVYSFKLFHDEREKPKDLKQLEGIEPLPFVRLKKESKYYKEKLKRLEGILWEREQLRKRKLAQAKENMKL